ncbi:SPW repeat domain-containing protein [Gemmata sp.]|uniref:SPW repeat domain-containing protein n=1 Tax=Gemmata sp. TaxID=1914242 RepID=UPI003F72EFD3
MRFIPTRVHGVLDYLWGASLVAAPWAGGFGSMWAEAMVPVAIGFGAIFYSLFTEYECGVRSVIPMRMHLQLDVAAGALLAASPWLFGFAGKVWVPHVAFGLFAVAVALTTRLVPHFAPVQPEPFGPAT